MLLTFDLSTRSRVILHCIALFTMLAYGLHHVINEIALLGYLLLASTCLLSVSLFYIYKNNHSLLPLKLFSVTITIAIIVTCYYLGMRGIIFVFPLITSYFYSFPLKLAVPIAIVASVLSLLASLHIVDSVTVLRLAVALTFNVFFITSIAHLVYVQQKVLLKEAREDHLTGIANRRCFHELLTQALIEGKKLNTIVALLYMDLDNFKAVNDNHGHNIGDLVLQEASLRLQSCIRDDDAVYQLEDINPKEHVARLGGDEFAIIIKNLNSINGINEVIGRILHKMNAPYIIDGLDLHCHASIGMAWNKDKDSTPEILMHQADTAMYKAKQNRKTGYHTFSI